MHNPEYLNKVKRKAWIGKTPKTLAMYKQDGDTYIAPYGFKDTLLAFLIENNISYSVDDKTSQNTLKMIPKQDLSLYDYQVEAVNKLNEKTNGILVSPTGSGKTRMGMALIGLKNVKTLWITNKIDLLKQSKAVFESFYENKAGEISGGKVNIQDVTFATVQTLNNIDLNSLKDTFDLVVTDEVHRVVGAPTNTMQFYQVLSSLNAKYKFGLTATLFNKPNYASQTPLYVVGDVIHEIDSKNIPRVNAEHIMVELDTQPSDKYILPDRTIDFMEQVNYLFNNYDRNMAMIERMLANQHRHNIVLSNRNEHLNILCDLLESLGMKVGVVIGETKAKDREHIYDEFRKGNLNFLLSNYLLLKEGQDLPIADTLHLVMPVRDKITTIQSVGRIERLFKGKENAYVFDYVDINIGNILGMYRDRRRHLNAR